MCIKKAATQRAAASFKIKPGDVRARNEETLNNLLREKLVANMGKPHNKQLSRRVSVGNRPRNNEKSPDPNGSGPFEIKAWRCPTLT
jgi:hypothetical protein